MDRKEKYVTTLLRTLIKKGIITFIGSFSGALAVGPNGYMLGPVVTVVHDYFSSTSEEEKILEPITKTELFQIAVTIAIKLAVENISTIIKICRDIIRLLKRLFNVKEESADNARMLLHYKPPSA